MTCVESPSQGPTRYSCNDTRIWLKAGVDRDGPLAKAQNNDGSPQISNLKLPADKIEAGTMARNGHCIPCWGKATATYRWRVYKASGHPGVAQHT